MRTAMTIDYKKSAPYKAGEFHAQLGEMLMNPKTSITQLATFAENHGLTVNLQLVPVAGKEPAQSEGEQQ